MALPPDASPEDLKAIGGAVLQFPDGAGGRLSIASRPAGAAAVSQRQGWMEIPPSAEAVIAVFPDAAEKLVPMEAADWARAMAARVNAAAGEAAAAPRLPAGAALLRSGIDGLDELLDASLFAVEASAFDSGVIVAGSDGWYKNAWIRDGTYSVLGADLLGMRELAARFFRYWVREGGFSWGGENEAQQPAIGILGMRTHALLLPPEEAKAFLEEVFPYVQRYADYYAARVEKEGMLGTAEEWICQVPAPTAWPNAEVHAGLAAAAKIAAALGGSRPAAAEGARRWLAAAARLKEKLHESAYDASLKRFIPLAGPPGAVFEDQKDPSPWRSGPLRDERVDSGMLMLPRAEIFGRGLGAVDADDPRFAATQAWIHRALYQADRSISRFDANPASPAYPGGEWPAWPISASWAAQVEFLRGRLDRAWGHLLHGIAGKRGVDHGEALRQLPEQWRHDGRPVRTTRFLTWSHGELLTSAVFLLLGLELEPEGADLGLSPSLPPGSRRAALQDWPFRGWILNVEIAVEDGRLVTRLSGARSAGGPRELVIATAAGKVKLESGGTVELPAREPAALAPSGRCRNAPERARLFREILLGEPAPVVEGEASPEACEELIRRAEDRFDAEKLYPERARRQAELQNQLGPRAADSAGPLPAEGLRVATLFTAQEMKGALASEEGRHQAVEWCRRHGVEHVFVESFRDGYRAEEATLIAVRDRFRAAGLSASGCITPTALGKSSTGWKPLSCYTAEKTRAQLREVFAGAARLFDEIMIDDFLCTDCQCDECKEAKGKASWAEYRMRLLREASARDILAAARAVRPGVRVIIKYPQWYDDFHNRGYDVLGETALYPAIWIGTETRDPESQKWGRKAQYEAYYIMRWLGGIGGLKSGGGWFDPYGTSPRTYVEQARQTVLAGAREMLLFCHASLVEPQHALCAEALIPELPGLRALAREVRDREPVGAAAAKPPHSQPAKGEEYFFDFAGMLGIPLIPCTAVPESAPAALITSHAAAHPSAAAWLRASTRRPALVTAEAERLLPAETLAGDNRPVGRLSWKIDPREVMDLPRERLDALRSGLLAPFGFRFSAPGRVALYLFAPRSGNEGELVVVENFNDAPAEVTFEAEGRPVEEAWALVLPPSQLQEIRRRRQGNAETCEVPPRTLLAFHLARREEPARTSAPSQPAPRPAEPPERDLDGGLKSIQGRKTGFFHVERIDGRAWFITPEGNGFLSKGINHLSYNADQGKQTGKREYRDNAAKKYGSEEAFHRAALERLRGWGFNTLGAWCDGGACSMHILPCTVILNLAASTTRDAWLKGNTADVFSEEFAQAVRRQAEKVARPLASDPWLLGYFTDNELSFGPDWRVKTTLLDRMLGLPEGAAGRRAAEKALAEHGGDQKATAVVFAGLYARRYFEICREAVRAADPNHLILGCRFAGPPAAEVARAAAGLVEVFSVNIYTLEPDLAVLARLAEASRAPVLIGEFAFRARDSGLPNTRGAGPVVETQADRAAAFARYVEHLLSSPEAVGYHWFEHQDEPAEGRFDGEDSNYGLVDLQDRPYPALVERMTEVNQRAEALAREAGKRPKK